MGQQPGGSLQVAGHSANNPKIPLTYDERTEYLPKKASKKDMIIPSIPKTP